MHRYQILIEYVGTNFVGWQIQTKGKSIQKLIQVKLSKILKEKILLVGSGRTDSGVHAIEQSAHFECKKEIQNLDKFLKSINHFINDMDVSIINIKKRNLNFHARFSATRRSYLYNIFNNQTPSALWSDRSLFVTQQLDIRSMRAASKYLIGEHDFTSFRGSGCQAKTSLRNIDNIEISKKDRFIRVELSANAFLLHMVRIIIGTLLMVGKKEIKPKEVENILKQQDRRLAGKTVSSSGLFFLGPEYPQKYNIPGFQNNLI